MFKKLIVIAALISSPYALANDNLTIETLAQNSSTKTSFNKIVKQYKLPNWVLKGGVGSPAATVTLNGNTYQVMTACKPHNCGAEQIAIIYSEKQKTLSGVFSVVDEKQDKQALTWLNIPDALSIDGKTVLFASLSGSLDNHPNDFNYK